MNRKPPLKKPMAPSNYIFNLGAVVFLITAVPIRVFVDHPLIFVIGNTCSFVLFLSHFFIATLIRFYGMDDQLIRMAEDEIKERKRKKNKRKDVSKETEES